MDSSHSNSSLCAEASEELEALFAIFGDDVRYIQPSDGFASAISMHFRPRTADDALNSFVTADLIVYLPQAYPACLPLAKLSRSSGFGDDGAALAAYISACLSKSALGEPLLMNLFEYIFDFLDGLNEGECLICNESLQSAAGGELAVRTNCYHCFHIHCLCRWGAVLHIANLNAKTGSIEHTKAASAIKSLEGDLRALEETKLNTESEISRLEEEIASILKTLGSMCTPPIAEENNKTSKQKDGKASSSQTVTGPSVVAVAPHVNVNKKGRKGMTDQQPACTSAPMASVNTAKVIEEELSKDERRHMRNQCNNYASALSVARQRHEKIIARYLPSRFQYAP